MKADLYNQKGKKVGTLEVTDGIFAATPNETVLAQYVYSYLSNQREGNAHTKDRSEVSGGGKKPWRQKGTGRARFGSSRNPIWRKGGVAFGPRNEVNWKKKITKKLKSNAIRSAFSKLTDNKMLNFVEAVKLDSKKPLTRQALDIINSFENPKKVTVITAEVNKELVNAFSNLKNHKVVLVKDLNAYDVLTGGKILIEQEALEYINKHWN